MKHGVARLNPDLLRRLQSDGFTHIGKFEIEGAVFHYTINDAAVAEWLFSIYAWVSVIGEGKVLRIGKSEGPLRIRLAAYKRSLDDVMSGHLGPNEYFKGDTQPWEREGWNNHARSPGAGLIFAKQVTPLAADGIKVSLRTSETRLIREYKPVLCPMSEAGRQAKRVWEAEHGPAFPISKRATVRLD
jgi:hypothetical protein